MQKNFKFREIPYNYTSFSDKEIILKYFDEKTWDILNELRNRRVTGRSAKLLFEVVGDIFIIDRNPYIYNDFLENKRKIFALKKLHQTKLNAIRLGADSDDVISIIEKAEKFDKDFFAGFAKEKKFRKKIFNNLKNILSEENIHFSAFQKVAHVTDASDWRVEYPQVVVYPSNRYEIIGLIRSAKELGLKIIPRGGGTGLTGGAVPVYKNTMVMNLEKLTSIDKIEIVKENGMEIPTINLGAGVITDTAMDYCEEEGYIFATDPTSAWASTIGGNIAENCGGKKCVMWGTAIDNIYSFEIINSWGEILEVKRRDHPHRKIEPSDEVIFDIYAIHKKNSPLIKSIILSGTDIRKKGIGKDITNKALGGVPGLQKEGGDGVIVSGKFILYKPFKNVKTVCLEFFGNNLINASKAIVEIRNLFEKNNETYLTALEHFDEKYVEAINYRNKSSRSDIPKAVILIDVESNNKEDLERSSKEMIDLVKEYNAEGFVADDEKERVKFWKDRKNLGAIAKHTNAFKLNEDIVIPIESLPLFADFTEKINITRELENNLAVVKEIKTYLGDINSEEQDNFLQSKISSFSSSITEAGKSFSLHISKINDPLKNIDSNYNGDDITVFEAIRDKTISPESIENIISNFKKIFHGYDELIEKFIVRVDSIKIKKIIIATHMHAGDGNIHVNIPVLSNDYEMMMEADETVSVIMKKTVELGGVISGEHGIGLTKLKFIDSDVLADYKKYKDENDPEDLFNPGKLTSDFPINMIYTPSFNLLEMEAFILEAADLESLATSISNCVRCGKCKDVCNTHYPGKTIFYSPRNKILGVSLITEAVLYEAQTETSLGFRNFKMLREISNHCTMCHNCYSPCPVDIDFGEVTLSIKSLLVERKRSSFKFVTWFVLFYLKKRGYYFNKIARISILKIGYSFQRIGVVLNRPFRKLTEKILPKINGLLMDKLPGAGKKTLRETLSLKGDDHFFALSNPNIDVKKSVLYFPGCGSERMFSDISYATIALLYYSGVRVVLTPEYLCCGYPFMSNGKVKQAKIKSYENRVMFHRIAETIGYMKVEDVVVSCGTCYEMLNKYHIENIFPNGTIIDINEFILRENLIDLKKEYSDLIYHKPCHSPLQKYGYEKIFSNLLKTSPELIPKCCGEGGTLALSTPEISNSLRDRKKNYLPDITNSAKPVILTTCPSCVQGLSKIGSAVEGKSLVDFLADEHLGKNWKKQFIKDIKRDKGIEKILL